MLFLEGGEEEGVDLIVLTLCVFVVLCGQFGCGGFEENKGGDVERWMSLDCDCGGLNVLNVVMSGREQSAASSSLPLSSCS